MEGFLGAGKLLSSRRPQEYRLHGDRGFDSWIAVSLRPLVISGTLLIVERVNENTVWWKQTLAIQDARAIL